MKEKKPGSTIGLALVFSLGLVAAEAAGAGGDSISAVPPAPTPIPRPPVQSPEVHADGRVTFRVKAVDAKSVQVDGEWGGGRQPLCKDDDGLWTVTLDPLPPGLWGYGFIVDGLRMLDPGSAAIKPSRVPTTSWLLVPAQPPRAYEDQGHPRGTVHLHDYNSAPLGGRLRSLRVYTPPGYESGRGRFPVLYLMHGFSDNQAAWTEFGRAHLIADNLIANKQAVPMIIVMPDGHTMGLDRARLKENLANIHQDVLQAVMPLVQRLYRIKAGAVHHAVVGLSMGGEHALTLGMNHADKFAWVGGMSSATRHLDLFAPALADPTGLNRRLKLLWMAIGKDDFLLNDNHALVAVLNEKGVRHEYRETEGGHTWPVWRTYLIEVLPRLFKTTRGHDPQSIKTSGDNVIGADN